MTITLEGIEKQFKDVPVLRGIDLSLAPGCVTALIGASGSGKTTLLNIIAGLVVPSAGRVLFNGQDVTPLDAADRRIGYVFQSFALFPHLSVLDNVAFGLRTRGVGRRERHARALVALERVRMADYAGRRIDALSGGQRQRVALARALAPEPEILLLDEPLSALDPVLRDNIRDELREMLEPLDITTLIVTHDKADAFVLADRIVMLSGGRVLQEGTPRDLYDRPAHIEVASFFGAVNMLPEAGDGTGLDQAPVIFRPEDTGRAPSAAQADFTITIARRLYLGDRVRVRGLTSEGHELSVDLPKHTALREGEMLHLTLLKDGDSATAARGAIASGAGR
jgi:ABC-type Fe3+/spermidine/putrescine transport system ATPase subunit